jgi:hypothetical protein
VGILGLIHFYPFRFERKYLLSCLRNAAAEVASTIRGWEMMFPHDCVKVAQELTSVLLELEEQVAYVVQESISSDIQIREALLLPSILQYCIGTNFLVNCLDVIDYDWDSCRLLAEQRYIEGDMTSGDRLIEAAYRVKIEHEYEDEEGCKELLELLLQHRVDFARRTGSILERLELVPLDVEITKHMRDGFPQEFPGLLEQACGKDFTGKTILHRAIDWSSHENLRELLNVGIIRARINSKDIFGRTALHIACESDDLVEIEALISAGADASIQAFGQLTPLHFAAAAGNETVIHYLVTGVSRMLVNALESYGRSPLAYAAMNGHAKVVDCLLEYCGHVGFDLFDSNGRTPLSWAAQKGHEAVVKKLVGSSLMSLQAFYPDHYGITPIEYAANSGHERIAAVLKGLLDEMVDS